MPNRRRTAQGVSRRLLLTVGGLTAIVASTLLNAPSVRAQSQAATSGPAFEVASVKPNNSADLRRPFDISADRLQAMNFSLQELIELAYGDPGPPRRMFPAYRIEGGPSWIRTSRFDVIAKVGGDASPNVGSVRQKLLMLQTLLAERFRLIVHHETRQAPIYALVLARNDGRLGQNLHRSTVDCDAVTAARGRATAPAPAASRLGGVAPCTAFVGMGTMHVGDATMSTIASLLSQLLNRSVVDRTGLSGLFEFDLQFSLEGLPGIPLPPAGADRTPSDSAQPSIFTALQEQLGLKLDPQRGPVDVLVIDRVERPTAD